MSAVFNAYKLCIGVFKQDSAGTVFASLPEQFASMKWNLESIIPADYDFTNFQVGDTTIETTETNTITQLSKSRNYDSGAVTPPAYTFATLSPADAGSIVAALSSLDVDDPFKILLCAGVYKSTAGNARTYDVFHASAGILTTDGGRSGDAKQHFTGSLGIQACHLPVVGAENCAASLVWDESTNAISLSVSGQ